MHQYVSAAMTSSLKHFVYFSFSCVSIFTYVFTDAGLKHVHTLHFYTVHVTVQYLPKSMFNSLKIKQKSMQM